MADVSKIKLPSGTTYNIKDGNALPLTGGSVTGPVSFGDSVSIDEATIGDLVVNGSASFTNNLQANTINGVTVGSNPKFTDTNTITTATTTGSGNAVTAITASNGALTVTKGTTFLTSHQDISGKADKSATVSTVAYDSTNKKITKTINGTTSDVVTVATLKTALGYTASDIGIKFGYTTSGNNRAVQQDSSGNLYVTQKDTTYKAGSGLSLSSTTFSSKNSHLVNGSATGSLRTTGSTSEGSSYTIGQYAFAEGRSTKASGDYSHAEGYQTTASNSESHAEGYNTTASGDESHAEGISTIASGNFSHAEGYQTTASSSASHAEGYEAKAQASYSHAQNFRTIAQGQSQTVIGQYNVAQGSADSLTTSDYAFIIGNGTSNTARSNALTVDWSGNVDITSGATYKINGVALSASDVGAQPTLVSGTNIKTINNQSILGSGNIPAASIPTANTIAKFDSTAHMSSTDMTTSEVSDFVNSLNIGGGDEIINLFYPVGSYYETEDGTFNPNVAWGGTWVLESTAKQPTGESARISGRNTVNVTTTSSITVLTLQFTSKTGRVYVHADCAFFTSRYTSLINLKIDGVQFDYSTTNSTTLQRGVVEGITDVEIGAHTATVVLGSQDSGTTATLPPYNTYTLFVMDVANPNGGVYKWHRTA